MKAIGIIGYKKSGKTSLLVSLARELTKRGHIIASVKHSSCNLDLPDTDTSLHKQFARQVAAIAPDESAIFFQESIHLDEMLGYLKADFVLIEGFKEEKTFPKIVCLRPEDDPETLLDGLEICVISEKKISGLRAKAPILEAKGDIGKISDLVENKAFKLPDLDCGACGYSTCYEMAKQIIGGLKTVDDCIALNADVQIKIDEHIVPLNPFVSGIVKNTIQGMLSALKGYQKGKIEISIKAPH